MQRHEHRHENWFVAEGRAVVYSILPGIYGDEEFFRGSYERFAPISISQGEWHKLCNETNSPLKIIEIQYGDKCVEEDIERKI